MSSTLVYALDEALAIVEEEGLEAAGRATSATISALLEALRPLGLSVLPPEGERLWTLNAVRVPDGIDEAAVRRHLLDKFNIEIGAGLGPLAGKIWRVGLMGASSVAAPCSPACAARSNRRLPIRGATYTPDTVEKSLSQATDRNGGRRLMKSVRTWCAVVLVTLFGCVAYAYSHAAGRAAASAANPVDDRVHRHAGG